MKLGKEVLASDLWNPGFCGGVITVFVAWKVKLGGQKTSGIFLLIWQVWEKEMCKNDFVDGPHGTQGGRPQTDTQNAWWTLPQQVS